MNRDLIIETVNGQNYATFYTDAKRHKYEISPKEAAAGRGAIESKKSDIIDHFCYLIMQKRGPALTIRYATKPNQNGVRYTLNVYHTTKTYTRGYNDAWSYHDHITIMKSDQEKIINMLNNSGYREV